MQDLPFTVKWCSYQISKTIIISIYTVDAKRSIPVASKQEAYHIKLKRKYVNQISKEDFGKLWHMSGDRKVSMDVQYYSYDPNMEPDMILFLTLGWPRGCISWLVNWCSIHSMP